MIDYVIIVDEQKNNKLIIISIHRHPPPHSIIYYLFVVVYHLESRAKQPLASTAVSLPSTVRPLSGCHHTYFCPATCWFFPCVTFWDPIRLIMDTFGVPKARTKPERPTTRLQKMEIIPLGSGAEVGRSCHVLRYKGKTVMLDCGMHPGYSGAGALPFFDEVDW